MTTPTLRLKAALRGYLTATLLDLAERAGADGIAARRAHKGQPINVSNYLKLCQGLGIDPMTGEQRAGKRLGDFHRTSLGCAVSMWRFQTCEGLRPAAKRMGIKYSTLQRIEHGEAVSVSAIFKVCRYIGRHPHLFTSPPEIVSRRTSTGTLRTERTRELAT